MENNNVRLKAKGIRVEKTYGAGEEPKITHVVFEFKNLSNKKQNVTIENIICKIQDHDIAIKDYFIYSLPDYIEIDKKNFIVNAGVIMQIEITFPFINIPVGLLSEIFVEVTLKYGLKCWTIKSTYSVNIRN